jgi:hypothetical protein
MPAIEREMHSPRQLKQPRNSPQLFTGFGRPEAASKNFQELRFVDSVNRLCEDKPVSTSAHNAAQTNTTPSGSQPIESEIKAGSSEEAQPGDAGAVAKGGATGSQQKNPAVLFNPQRGGPFPYSTDNRRPHVRPAKA